MASITPYRFQRLVYGDRRLTRLRKSILLRIALDAVASKDPDGWVTLSQQEIADDIAAERANVSRAMPALTAAGYLERQQQVISGQYTAARYRLSDDAWNPAENPDRVTSDHMVHVSSGHTVHVSSGHTVHVSSGHGNRVATTQRVRSTQESLSTRPPGRAETATEKGSEQTIPPAAVAEPRSDGDAVPPALPPMADTVVEVVEVVEVEPPDPAALAKVQEMLDAGQARVQRPLQVRCPECHRGVGIRCATPLGTHHWARRVRAEERAARGTTERSPSPLRSLRGAETAPGENLPIPPLGTNSEESHSTQEGA